MKPLSFMLIAGEASGDLLAAELVRELRRTLAEAETVPTDDHQPLRASLEPRFFGAGGPRMAEAGVDLAFDMTGHSLIGFTEALRNVFKFRRIFLRLYRLALARQPDVIICVDFSGFNRRFAHAIRKHVRSHSDWFHDWKPKIIQYVSPQVWASRPGRAEQMAQDYDLLLCTFPFEKEWYARHAPRLQVEFVGNPVVDRVGRLSHRSDLSDSSDRADSLADGERIQVPLVVLLPGSRADELRRHLPVLLSALNIIRAAVPDLRARLVLPSEALIGQARGLGLPPDVSVQMGDLTPAIRQATLALAKTGTITLECAYFGIPTVAIYKTSWSTFQVARRIVNVKYVAMPNLLANEAIIPELIQHEATPENIARAALELLRSKSLRGKMKERLLQVAASLGGPGASARAAQAILRSWGPFFCL